MWDELTKYIFSAVKTQILFHSQVHLFIFDPKISTDVFVIFENARLKTRRPWSTFCLRVVSYTFVIVKNVIFLLYVQIRWELSAGSCFVFMSEAHLMSFMFGDLRPTTWKQQLSHFVWEWFCTCLSSLSPKHEMEAADNSPELSFSISYLSYRATHTLSEKTPWNWALVRSRKPQQHFKTFKLNYLKHNIALLLYTFLAKWAFFCIKHTHKRSSFSRLTLQRKALYTWFSRQTLGSFAAVEISVHLHASSHDPLLYPPPPPTTTTTPSNPTT